MTKDTHANFLWPADRTRRPLPHPMPLATTRCTATTMHLLPHPPCRPRRPDNNSRPERPRAWRRVGRRPVPEGAWWRRQPLRSLQCSAPDNPDGTSERPRRLWPLLSPQPGTVVGLCVCTEGACVNVSCASSDVMCAIIVRVRRRLRGPFAGCALPQRANLLSQHAVRQRGEQRRHAYVPTTNDTLSDTRRHTTTDTHAPGRLALRKRLVASARWKRVVVATRRPLRTQTVCSPLAGRPLVRVREERARHRSCRDPLLSRNRNKLRIRLWSHE